MLAGSLVGGGLDLLDAIVFFGLRNGVPPVRIFQSIARLPPLLHRLRHVAVYFLASRSLPVLTRQWIVCGILYGIGAYFFMNDVVIPLSATTRGAFAWPVFVNGLAIHMFGVGLVAAWFATHG